jgi:hypothetical protein
VTPGAGGQGGGGHSEEGVCLHVILLWLKQHQELGAVRNSCRQLCRGTCRIPSAADTIARAGARGGGGSYTALLGVTGD